jgi:flagellar basal body L-ring protein FlgH
VPSSLYHFSDECIGGQKKNTSLYGTIYLKIVKVLANGNEG